MSIPKKVDRRASRKAWYDEKDRKIRALIAEQDELYDIKYQAPLVELDTPYQKGYKKFFVLREATTRRYDAHIISRILKKINNYVFFEKPDFKKKVKSHRDHRGRRIAEHERIIEPSLGWIGPHAWEKLSENDKKDFKKYLSSLQFRHVMAQSLSRSGGSTNVLTYAKGYFCLYPWFFETRIEPHFITHVRTLYPNVEARLKEISNTLRKHNLWTRYAKLKGYPYRDDDWYLSCTNEAVACDMEDQLKQLKFIEDE